MQNFELDDMDDLERKPEVEGKTGTIVDLPRDRWIRMLAASEHNPKWKAVADEFNSGLRRLVAAEASRERLRLFCIPFYANALILEWGGIKSKAVEVPYGPEIGIFILRKYADVYEAIDEVIWKHKNFRGQRIQIIEDELKN